MKILLYFKINNSKQTKPKIKIQKKNNYPNSKSIKAISGIVVVLQAQRPGTCVSRSSDCPAVAIFIGASYAEKSSPTYVIIIMCIFPAVLNVHYAVPPTHEAIICARIANSSIQCTIQTRANLKI